MNFILLFCGNLLKVECLNLSCQVTLFMKVTSSWQTHLDWEDWENGL